MIRMNGLKDSQSVIQGFAEAQQKISTGYKFHTISDDPVSAALYARADRHEAAVKQHDRNILHARQRVELEESVLNQLSELAIQAREIGLQEGSAGRNAETRASQAGIIDQLIQAGVSLGNSKIGNDYIFGGTETQDPPFLPDGTYVGDGEPWPVTIDEGVTLVPSTPGDVLFTDTGFMDSLTDLRDALLANDEAAILDATGDIGGAYNEIQRHLSATGVRSTVLSSTEALHDESLYHLTNLKSDLRHVDLAEAVSELATREVAMNAALTAVQRAMNLDLTRFLG